MVDLRLRAGLRHHQIGARLARAAAAAPESGQRSSGSATVADSPTLRELRRQREQPRQAERQQIAALGRHQRMQFVEHHALERAEQIRRIGACASSSASCSGVVSRMSGG